MQTHNDLEILFPQRHVEAGGKTFTIQELNFAQSLEHHDRIAPLVESLRGIIESEHPTWEAVQALFAAHHDAVTRLLAICCGCEEKDIKALSAQDGQMLLSIWWDIHAPFFVTAAVDCAKAAVHSMAQATQAGDASLPA